MFTEKNIHHNSRSRMSRIELLSPAGSAESLRAAVNAGADAIYLGGKKYGARAFANNFSDRELLDAIDYVHLHGKKIYLTVNTIMKEDEYMALASYIEPLYKQGLDAVIVQDAGAMSLCSSMFPDMEIHASTQMSVLSAEGAKLLKNLGVARVVPGRELSLDEIRDIVKTGIDVECFVHGALCYCVSGQCFMSSLAGGRSGNRGQCAQPCRQPYKTSDGKTSYVMSLKDICTIEHIPELIESGIHSFKIEGRMKKPEYVAIVTATYRKYIDLYMNTPELFDADHTSSKKIKEEMQRDIRMMQDVYNRSGFSAGYLHQHNGGDMITKRKPGHTGVAVLKVKTQRGREVECRCIENISAQDVVELCPTVKDTGRHLQNYTFGKSVNAGETVRLLLPKGLRLNPDQYLYRTKNDTLLKRIQNTYIESEQQQPIWGTLQLNVGQSAVLTVGVSQPGREPVSVCVHGELSVMKAKNRPLDERAIRRVIQQTGETPFCFRSLDILMEKDIFLPNQELKMMRREALRRLEKTICDRFHREQFPEVGTDHASGDKALPLNEHVGIADIAKRAGEEKKRGDRTFGQYKQKTYSVSVETSEQLEMTGEFIQSHTGLIERLYVSFHVDGNIFPSEHSLRIVEGLKKLGLSCYLILPSIFRKQAAEMFDKIFQNGRADVFDGLLVRSIDSLGFLMERNIRYPVILDFSFPCMNESASRFYRENFGAELTNSPEISAAQIEKMRKPCEELHLYGYVPVMVSAQCAVKTKKGCTKCSEHICLYKADDSYYEVAAICPLCYTVTYSDAAIDLSDLSEHPALDGVRRFRISLTTENGDLTGKILRKMINGENIDVPILRTHGRFHDGIR